MGALHGHGAIHRALIIAPVTVCAGWPDEIDKFAAFPHEMALLLGAKGKRIDALQALEAHDNDTGRPVEIAIINYESTFREDMFDALKAFKPDIVIADESQRIKNHSASQSKAVQALGDLAKYRLILSGTPVQNNAVDLYSQYRFLDPAVFGSNFYAFRNRYCVMGGFNKYQIVGYKNMDEMVRKEHSIAYRVTKEECLDLPPETSVNRWVDFEPKERKVYEDLRRASIAELENGDRITATTVLTKILRLQQLTGGFMVPDDAATPVQANREKLLALQDIIEDYVVDGGKKLVIFARFRAEIHAIMELLKENKVPAAVIDGDVPMDARGDLVRDFQQADGTTQVMVCQIQAAGLGITLHAASTAVIYSLDYNYANYAQCLARIHRIGQQSPVTYIHLLVRDSIDTKVMAALSKKADLAASIVDNWREIL